MRTIADYQCEKKRIIFNTLHAVIVRDRKIAVLNGYVYKVHNQYRHYYVMYM